MFKKNVNSKAKATKNGKFILSKIEKLRVHNFNTPHGTMSIRTRKTVVNFRLLCELDWVKEYLMLITLPQYKSILLSKKPTGRSEKIVYLGL